MNIEKVIQDDRQAKLTVEYTAEEFEGFKRRAAKNISKKSKIHGFRPGKAPYNVILNHFGEDAIVQEAIDIILDNDYAKVLEKAEINPSGVGSLDSIESTDPPKFVFMIPLEPEVELGEYREIRKDYALEPFDENQIETTITNARRKAASIIPADRPAVEGDLVYFTLSGEFLNPEEEEDATITDKTPQQALIPKEDKVDLSEWPFPGFARELLSVKAGDIKEIQHAYPDDYSDEEYRGKTAVFSVDVQSVKALELPDLDEEFVQTLGDYESPEDFRKTVEEGLRRQHESEYEESYFEALLNEITEQSKLAYPPQMLEERKDQLLEDIKTRVENQNLDFETYLRLRGTDETKLIEEEILPAAKKRLERSLIVEALIKEEKIKLDQEKLQKDIQEVMHDILHSGDYEAMQKEMGNENFSRAISMEAVNRTITEQLYERLKLIATGQPIPEEEETSEESSEEPSEDLTAEELSGEVESSPTEDVEKIDDNLEEIISEVSVEEENDELEEEPEEVIKEEIEEN